MSAAELIVDLTRLGVELAAHGDRPQDDGDNANGWLRQALADGELPAADVLKEGRANGYSQKAVRKAFKALGGERRREGFGRGGPWLWWLPSGIDGPIVAIDAIDSDPANNGNNANNGQEWGEV